jgi:shikimate dehydrogenase
LELYRGGKMEKSYLDNLTGVFGHPVAENPTVVMIEAGFKAMGLANWRYLTLDVGPESLKKAMESLKFLGFRGINLTIPHKVEVIQYLDEISEAAEKIGAVNTVVNRNGKLYGENTDGKGFLTGLRKDMGIDPKGKRVTVIGAGGAARAICVELGLAGAETIMIVNRTEKKAADLAERVGRQTSAAAEARELTAGFSIPADTDILVQATSIGLYPDTAGKPDIDYSSVSSNMTVCDVIPNPPNTPFLVEAKQRAAAVIDGLSMLVYQGVIGFKLWTGMEPSVDVMKQALRKEFGL